MLKCDICEDNALSMQREQAEKIAAAWNRADYSVDQNDDAIEQRDHAEQIAASAQEEIERLQDELIECQADLVAAIKENEDLKQMVATAEADMDYWYEKYQGVCNFVRMGSKEIEAGRL